MEYLVSHASLDLRDGLNATRALILQSYYALRRTLPTTLIGTPQILAWIKLHEPGEPVPSDSLVLLTLRHAKVAHRPPGRPRGNRSTPVPASPFFLPRRSRLHDSAQR